MPIERALHSLVGSIDRSLKFKECVLVAFFDVEGDFNNFSPDSIVASMRSLKIDDGKYRFVDILPRMHLQPITVRHLNCTESGSRYKLLMSVKSC